MPVKIVSDDKKFGPLAYVGNPAPISETEYRNGLRTFNSHFRFNGSGNKAKLFPILRSEIDTLVQQELPNATDQQRAVIVFYHGYDQSNGLRRGVRVATHAATSSGDNWDISPELGEAGKLPTHEFIAIPNVSTSIGSVSNHPLYALRPITSTTEWEALQLNYYSLCSRHLSPQTNNPTNFTQPSGVDDPKAVYFPYKAEIWELANQNSPLVSPGVGLYYIVADFCSFLTMGGSRVNVSRDGYYHSVSIHTAYIDSGQMIQLIEDGTSASTIVNDGIDYGHICPPRCDRAALNSLNSLT